MADERDSLVEVKTRIPERALFYMNKLVSRGYFSSAADFARQAILDILINDFELGIAELEPEILEQDEKECGDRATRKNRGEVLAKR